MFNSKIFINLPVKNLDKSQELYTQMGFFNNKAFSDETAKCMVFSDEIFVMLHTHERFKSFIKKPIADLQNHTALLLSLNVENIEKVNEICNNAISAGGTEPIEAKDYGFMQQRTIEDFDGHIWEIFYMDESKIPQQ